MLRCRLHVQTVFKAHESAVHAMQLCQLSSGSATPGPLGLVTSGEILCKPSHSTCSVLQKCNMPYNLACEVKDGSSTCT